MLDLTSRLQTALDITESAAAVALSYFRGDPSIEVKADQSPVTIADQHTEQVIRDRLARAFPGEAIFGEEFGQTGKGTLLWIIDPIDGTRSFITGLPLFGMLLGFVKDDKPLLGIIRMPALGEVYAGAIGLGATCNGAPITVSACKNLSSARLFINEADRIAVSEPDIFARLVRAGELRRMGADCYSHALVARGLADAVIDYGLQPYDHLPVRAVIEAAGGIMTDWQGAPLTMASDGHTITAATPALHAEMMALVKP